MNDCILGLCAGYRFEQVRPFLASLRKTGFAGDVVLFCHDNPPETGDALRRLGARVVPFALPSVPDVHSYNVVRYRLFLDWLCAAQDAERVLLVDVRDVLFQRDPFSFAVGDELHSFLEDGRKTIGDCIWTSSWIKYRYGDARLAPLRDRPIACSGATVGRRDAVLAYLERMAEELEPWLPGRNYMAGYDQGVHNVLAHEGRLPNLRLWPQAESPVLHLGNTPEADIRVNERGEVLNEAGEPALIVHQYDRHPALAEKLLARI